MEPLTEKIGIRKNKQQQQNKTIQKKFSTMDASKTKELCRMHRWYKKKTGYTNLSKDTTLFIPQRRNARKITNAYRRKEQTVN